MIGLKEFMSNVFNTLTKKFPNASIAYQHKEISDTHFFKIIPSSIYDSEEFTDLDFYFNDKFEKLGFEGFLCFITEGSLTSLENPSRINKPNLYNIPCLETIDRGLLEKNTYQWPEKFVVNIPNTTGPIDIFSDIMKYAS